jgi:hypothetical protein
MYGTLLTPAMVSKWSENKIVAWCNVTVSQRRHRWRQKMVLKNLKTGCLSL